MIRHDDVHPLRLGERDPVDAGGAVVHGHDHIRLALERHLDELRRQAIPELEPVGNQKVHPVGTHAEGAQHRDAQRRRRGAVGVEVAGDEDSFAIDHGCGKAFRRSVDAGQRRRWVQVRQGQVEVRRGADPARRQRFAQEDWHVARQVGLLLRPGFDQQLGSTRSMECVSLCREWRRESSVCLGGCAGSWGHCRLVRGPPGPPDPAKSWGKHENHRN